MSSRSSPTGPVVLGRFDLARILAESARAWRLSDATRSAVWSRNGPLTTRGETDRELGRRHEEHALRRIDPRPPWSNP